ncbi:MAG TPA: hypothetical protein VK752_13665 [Bryobacteraceae bacterium]|jgi:hypothetical protein|nr:hypothetical protein [Bryobacteraceae bacterium]
MDLDAKVRFFRRIETPSMPEIGRVLAHRSIVEEANRQGLKNVLVFEEGFVEEVPPFPQRGLAGPPPASRDGLQSSPF